MREAGLAMPEDQEAPAGPPARACGQLFIIQYQNRRDYLNVVNSFTRQYTQIIVGNIGDVVDDCEPFVFALETLRFFGHLIHNDRITREPERKDNTKYLIQFMVGELTEKQMQSKIMQREKNFQQQCDLKAVHDIFWETGNHLMDVLFHAPRASLSALESFRAQMMNLFEMCNERLAKIAKVYGNKEHCFKMTSRQSELPPIVWIVSMSYE